MWPRTATRQCRDTWTGAFDFGICVLEKEQPILQVSLHSAIYKYNQKICSPHFCLSLLDLHEGGITSVHFNPIDSTQVLTNGFDASLKIVDVRTSMPLQTLRHLEFQTSHSWSRATFSPDGKYVASGSSSNGTVFVWNTLDGTLKKKLKAHDAGVVGIDWGRGGSSGQQVATLDRRGTLILWA